MDGLVVLASLLALGLAIGFGVYEFSTYFAPAF